MYLKNYYARADCKTISSNFSLGTKKFSLLILECRIYCLTVPDQLDLLNGTIKYIFYKTIFSFINKNRTHGNDKSASISIEIFKLKVLKINLMDDILAYLIRSVSVSVNPSERFYEM